MGLADAGRDCGQEEKGTTEDEMAGCCLSPGVRPGPSQPFAFQEIKQGQLFAEFPVCSGFYIGISMFLHINTHQLWEMM